MGRDVSQLVLRRRTLNLGAVVPRMCVHKRPDEANSPFVVVGKKLSSAVQVLLRIGEKETTLIDNLAWFLDETRDRDSTGLRTTITWHGDCRLFSEHVSLLKTCILVLCIV